MCDKTVEYPFGPSWLGILGWTTSFGFVSFIVGCKAATNDRGLIIDGLRPILWLGSAVLGAAALYSLVSLSFHKLRLHQRIVIGPGGLTIPASLWSSQEKEVQYSEIVSVEILETGKSRCLRITYPGGNTRISPQWLPSTEAFHQLCALIADRVEAAGTGAPVERL